MLSLQLALTAYINSSFLASFIGENSVGFVFTLGSMAAISALLLIPKVLIRLGSYEFLLLAVAGSALSLLFLSIMKNVWAIIPIFIIYFAFNNIIIFILDELLEIFSKTGQVGKMRGFYLAVLSSAWVLSQIFLGKILESFSYQVLFFITFEIMVTLFLLCLLYLRDMPDPKYDRTPVFLNLKTFFKNKNLARSYGVGFLLQFFYSWMVIYTPIYLNAHLGFTWKEIGIIFTVMLTPFVFMPIPLGKYSDRIGEKKMLALGFAFASLATLSLFFIKTPNLWVWMVALFATRLGASTIEIMSDVYFFKHIAPTQDEFIGIYRNTSPVAYIVGPLIATILLQVLPSFNYLFPILAGIMALGIYLASTIKWGDV